MDFKAAITAHRKWKDKLGSYLAKPDRSLSPADVARDNLCDLGKWIVGEGLQFKALPEYQKLLSEHTRFHAVASDMVRRANTGEHLTEEIALGAHSDFTRVSSAVVTAIMALSVRVEKEALAPK